MITSITESTYTQYRERYLKENNESKPRSKIEPRSNYMLFERYLITKGEYKSPKERFEYSCTQSLSGMALMDQIDLGMTSIDGFFYLKVV